MISCNGQSAAKCGAGIIALCVTQGKSLWVETPKDLLQLPWKAKQSTCIPFTGVAQRSCAPGIALPHVCTPLRTRTHWLRISCGLPPPSHWSLAVTCSPLDTPACCLQAAELPCRARQILLPWPVPAILLFPGCPPSATALHRRRRPALCLGARLIAYLSSAQEALKEFEALTCRAQSALLSDQLRTAWQ
jgi:hypothetical protein